MTEAVEVNLPSLMPCRSCGQETILEAGKAHLQTTCESCGSPGLLAGLRIVGTVGSWTSDPSPQYAVWNIGDKP